MKITRNTLLSVLLFSTLCMNAQYPFEKHKAIHYKEYKDWKTTEGGKDSLPIMREITITDFDGKKSDLKIVQDLKLSLPDSLDYSELSIYRNNKKIKEFEVGTRSISSPLPVLAGDINGDGLSDLKILFPNYGCGNYNYYCQVAFLFQNKDGGFTQFVFSDIFEEFENKPERDFNNDGNYEIITQTFQNHARHNYWLFNIYNYKNGKLVNVNNIANYPIMVPLDSYDVSKKISKAKMKEFEIKSPIK